MKKILLVVSVFAIALLVFGVASFAYAQTQTPPSLEYPFGHGMMGVDGHGRMMGWDGEYGPMQDAMIAALAEALSLTPEEVETRHEAGETMWQIALTEGLSEEEIRDVMLSAHDLALEEAIANGWLTEEQAEWMDDHMESMWDGDFGFSDHCGGWGNNSRWQGEN